MSEVDALAAALAPTFDSARPLAARRVEAGWSNDVWRVRMAEGEYVVRLPRGDRIGGDAQRAREAEVWRRAAAADLVPEPVHLDARTGVLVTPAVATCDLGTHLDAAAPTASLVDDLGDLLRRFHALDRRGLAASDVIAELDGDLARTARAGMTHPPAVTAARARLPVFRRDALAHHDLTPANVLVGARLWLVDLERAGPGDGDLDLVSLAVSLGLDARAEERLFHAAGRARPDGARRRALGDLFQLREYAWAASRLVEGRAEGGISRQLSDSAAALSRSRAAP